MATTLSSESELGFASRGAERGSRSKIIIFLVALIWAAIVFAGGSSRPDNFWLLVQRPIIIISLIILLVLDRADWRAIHPLPLLLGIFALTIAVQLIPLPPQIWKHLNGRAQYNVVRTFLGGGDQWFPLTLDPDGTWNSLIALLVPFSVMVAFASLSAQDRLRLLWWVLGIIAFSVVLGLAQGTSSGESPLYWYRVSGRGQLIGLLANRNHQGALLALTLPLLRAWVLMAPRKKPKERQRRIIAACCAAVMVFMFVLVLGSRAGLLLTGVGVIAALLVEPNILFARKYSIWRWAMALIAIAGVVGVLLIVSMANRSLAIDRILNTNTLESEGRVAALPTMLDIIEKTLPFGTGFGTFQPVFNGYEPDSLLSPYYFNNAHNDLIELAITGGVASLVAFAAYLCWWVFSGYHSFFCPPSTRSGPWLQRASALCVLILFLASLTDYPLRTPLMGALFTLFCCWLADSRTRIGLRSRALSDRMPQSALVGSIVDC